MALWVVLHGPPESSPIECVLVHFIVSLPQLEFRLYESGGFICFVYNMIHSNSMSVYFIIFNNYLVNE